jgi:amidase
MKRRDFLKTVMLTGVAAASPTTSGVPFRAAYNRNRLKQFALEEITIAQLQAALQSGQFTSASLVQKYLKRIAQIDQAGPNLRSVVELNPDAFEIARDLDRERKSTGPRGPLHGVPVLIKDNIGTADRMSTSAGSLALSNSRPAQDSKVAQQLRRAGAVLLGKTNLSEWANFRSTRSTSGWSGRGGLTRNPYALDRNPSGSSSGSGSAVAANLCAVAVGTETDGSIVSPSSVNGLVGVKPTIGLISRSGIVPISHTQDTAGPMTRTVSDAAVLLGILAGADPRDEATSKVPSNLPNDYTTFLDVRGLHGARIGVLRHFFKIHPGAAKVCEEALSTMKRLGAIMVDPADLPSHGKFGDAESEVLLFDFKADLNAYLASLGPASPVHSLKDVIEFNDQNRATEMPYFEQELMLQAESKGPLTEQAYRDALDTCHRLARVEGIDHVMDANQLDALVAPTTGPAHLTDLIYGDRNIGGSSEPAAVAGYPSVTVPAGVVSGLPVGISFIGRAFTEGTLLKLAFAFEQESQVRRPPRFLSTAEA